MKLLPLVNFELTLEWWNGPKKLTLYIGPKTIDYIKVWSSDHQAGYMECNESVSIKELIAVLKWIFQ